MCGKNHSLRACGVGQIDDDVPTDGIENTASLIFKPSEFVLINLEG